MTQLNLSALPAPTVVETLDFETLVAQHKADLLARYPAAENVLHLASEPLVKQIEAFSYREMLLRDRVNQAARANLLAFAAGADLDHKAAFYGLPRLPAEDDMRFRQRIQLRIASLAGNGTAEQYQLLAMSTDLNVKDAGVRQLKPGLVNVVVWLKDMLLQAETLTRLNAAFSADNARPLGVPVTLSIARPVAINVTATLWRQATAPVDLVSRISQQCALAISDYANLGRAVPLSWITSVLHQPGIARVEFPLLAAGIPAQLTVLESDQYAVSGVIQLTDGGIA